MTLRAKLASQDAERSDRHQTTGITPRRQLVLCHGLLTCCGRQVRCTTCVGDIHFVLPSHYMARASGDVEAVSDSRRQLDCLSSLRAEHICSPVWICSRCTIQDERAAVQLGLLIALTRTVPCVCLTGRQLKCRPCHPSHITSHHSTSHHSTAQHSTDHIAPHLSTSQSTASPHPAASPHRTTTAPSCYRKGGNDTAQKRLASHSGFASSHITPHGGQQQLSRNTLLKSAQRRQGPLSTIYRLPCLLTNIQQSSRACIAITTRSIGRRSRVTVSWPAVVSLCESSIVLCCPPIA